MGSFPIKGHGFARVRVKDEVSSAKRAVCIWQSGSQQCPQTVLFHHHPIDGPRLAVRLLERSSRAAFFSTRVRHAARRAPRNTSSFATASRTCVAPLLPQPPATGRKTFGAPATNSACRSGVSIKLPYPCLSCASVAKMWPPTLKSTAPMCELSSAPSRLSAMRRKSAEFISALQTWRVYMRLLQARLPVIQVERSV